ncbi:hypothetical protein MSG28_012430 [Choristoneura fumiferana]|uniref:Uncharacterized protein n=1 Tax=Choristoneura fumiferana TaxID=7141 RepID=A0ACC0KCX9_CHOFU|nr:hypothetical protein MSG28_012430 [Choristoneura fumiferana]
MVGGELPSTSMVELDAKRELSKSAFSFAEWAREPLFMRNGGNDGLQKFPRTALARDQNSRVPEGRRINLSPILPMNDDFALAISFLNDLEAALNRSVFAKVGIPRRYRPHPCPVMFPLLARSQSALTTKPRLQSTTDAYQWLNEKSKKCPPTRSGAQHRQNLGKTNRARFLGTLARRRRLAALEYLNGCLSDPVSLQNVVKTPSRKALEASREPVRDRSVRAPADIHRRLPA